ncbi:MAG: transposase [Bacteroidetes bacterium]|nr:transposase [Bacteroidota bacterium]
MSFSKSSVQVELDRFLKSLKESPFSFETISRSAFTQSRKKLHPSAFIELASEQLNSFQSKAPNKKTWKGYRPIAIDGSTLNLPNSSEIKNHFGSTCNQFEEMSLAKCSFAYDVCNELIIDARISSYKSCEKDLAVEHLSKLNPLSDILIFDRGYPALWLMGLLQLKGFKFCFPSKFCLERCFSHEQERR